MSLVKEIVESYRQFADHAMSRDELELWIAALETEGAVGESTELRKLTGAFWSLQAQLEYGLVTEEQMRDELRELVRQVTNELKRDAVGQKADTGPDKWVAGWASQQTHSRMFSLAYSPYLLGNAACTPVSYHSDVPSEGQTHSESHSDRVMTRTLWR